MARALTLHHGENRAEFVEHPVETARRALLEAAAIEGEEWASLMRQFATALPIRRSVIKAGE